MAIITVTFILFAVLFIAHIHHMSPSDETVNSNQNDYKSQHKDFRHHVDIINGFWNDIKKSKSHNFDAPASHVFRMLHEGCDNVSDAAFHMAVRDTLNEFQTNKDGLTEAERVTISHSLTILSYCKI